MLELLFVIGFFIMLMVTGVSFAGRSGCIGRSHRSDVSGRTICLDD